jgi:hypothetical protein
LLDTIVDVSLRIGEKRVEKTFNVTVTNETGEKNVTVVLFGASSILERLKKEDLRVELIKNENGEEITQITLPDDLKDKVEVKNKK